MKIVQLNYKDEFILEYDTLASVQKLGFSYYKVRNALNKNKMAQGYKWIKLKSTKDIYEYNDRYYKPISPANPKKVEQLTRYGSHIRYWDSIESATINLDLPEGGINRCLLGEIKTTGGYAWKQI